MQVKKYQVRSFAGDSSYRLGSGLRDLDFPDFGTMDQLIAHDEIVVNRVADVHKRFRLRGALRPTAGQAGHGEAD